MIIYKSFMDKLVDWADTIYPICVPSYNRWDVEENKTLSLLRKMSDYMKSYVYVFIRKEQYANYYKSFPDFNLVVLPEVKGLAGTRQFIWDYAYKVLKAPIFLDMDDDIVRLDYIYTDNGLSSKHTLIGEKNPENIIKTAFYISDRVFKKFPKTIMGSFRRQRFCQGIENSQTCAIINKGATPRQVMVVNSERALSMGIRRNMIFDPTGDDVGLCAEILQNGGELFNIPCLSYDFVDDAINSTIRNDSNRRQLAQYEEQCLMLYDFGKYYMKKTFTFEDGSYKFCDIDWKAYHRLKGTKPSKMMLEELWNE